MIVNTSPIPTILSIGGFDPSGCAGLHADIETVTALGGHCMSLITCQTVQNGSRMTAQYPTAISLFQQQLTLLEEHNNWKGIKLGALGSLDIMRAITVFLDQHPKIPLVIDPVLASSSGYPFASNAMIMFLKEELIPRSTLITPNSPELSLLGASDDEQNNIQHLHRSGAKNILVTGGHDHRQNSLLINQLFSDNKPPRSWEIKRIKGHFRGTGCLISSAIATCLAKGLNLIEAIEQAQNFTCFAIEKAYPIEQDILIPGRLPFFIQP